MKLNRLVASTLFVICVGMVVVAQQEVRATYQPMEDRKVKVTWSVNFPAESGSAHLRTQKESLGMIEIDVPQEQIKTEYDKPVNPTKATFTISLEFGPDKPFSNNTVFADMTVRAFSGPRSNPSVAASTDLSLNAAAMRDYYDKIDKLDDFKVRFVPKPDPAMLTDRHVVKISDRSITLSLTSSQSIRAKVLAYETDDITKAVGDTVFKYPSDVLLFENKPTEVKVPELRGDKPYVLVVDEISGVANPAGRKPLHEVISRVNGTPIRTLPEVAKPSIRFIGIPQPKRSEAVYLEVSATDATDVFAYVEGSYDNGDFIKVSDEVRVTKKGGPAPVDPTVFAAQVPVALIPGRTYRVQARAVTDKSDDIGPAMTKSVEFKALPAKLFDIVTFDIGSETLKFTPTGVTEAVKTSMVMKVNEKQLLSPCVEGGPLQPSCEVAIAQIFTALADRNKNPGAAAAAPQKSTVSFEVTVKAADQSERVQTSTFAMSVTPPNLGNQAAKDNWQHVLSFAKDVITGSGNTKLEPNKLRSSGIAGFLGAMLRGFLIL